MAAWKHFNYWTEDFYRRYRSYVQIKGPKLQGKELDCADLSLSLMLDFAAENGLCLTFADNDGVRYISKGTHQSPKAGLMHHNREWKGRHTYVEAVLGRINAKSLVKKNMVINPRGPEVGDLMLKSDHAALVCKVYPPGFLHPDAIRFEENAPPKNAAAIPKYPGGAQAERQLHQLTYYRDSCPVFGPPLPTTHFDYLNHRGRAKPNAELILFTDVRDRDIAQFSFYNYAPWVLDNWNDWDGNADPPR